MLTSWTIHAQDYSLHIKTSTSTFFELTGNREYEDTMRQLSQEQMNKIINQSVQMLWSLGYLSTETSLSSNDSSNLYTCTLFPGPKYQKTEIIIEDALKPIWQLSGATWKRNYTPLMLNTEINKVLEFLSNKGYPYAIVHSSVLNSEEQSISLSLDLDKGNLYMFDSLLVAGSCELKNDFLAAYLSIQKGKPYSEQRVKELDLLLDRHPLLERTRNSQVFFLKNKVWVKIYVDQRQTDRLDGVIGLMPNNSVTNSRNLLITGELTLALNNLNKRAIEAGLNWRRFLKQSQSLEMGVSIPLVFLSPVGLSAKANILKLDSLFLETGIGFSASIRQKSSVQWFVNYSYKSTSVFVSDTARVITTGQLPSNHPYKSELYGLGVEWNRLDQLLNPTKGTFTLISFNLGLRNLLKDPNIERIKFDMPGLGLKSLYDTLDLTDLRGFIAVKQEFYIPVLKDFTGIIGYNGSYIIGNDVLFSEQFREGGMNSLRGYDERSIFAYNFTMFTAECRYLINRNSWVGLFANTARSVEIVESGEKSQNWLYGFGTSAQISTGKSLLKISYALGKPIEFRTAKIHFGIISYL